MDELAVIISCEHGGNHIPKPYRKFFRNHRALLNSHKGYDPGALELAGLLAGNLKSPLFAGTVSRLLVDLNRRIGHRQLFSEITRTLSDSSQQDILKTYYFPHRQALQEAIGDRTAAGKTLVHIASHSFTPVLDGKLRDMDIGLLYDPKIELEKYFCRLWKSALLTIAPEWKICFNAPYKGSSDGLTTYFRKIFPQRYLGIELEINQRFFTTHSKEWKQYGANILAALSATILVFQAGPGDPGRPPA